MGVSRPASFSSSAVLVGDASVLILLLLSSVCFHFLVRFPFLASDRCFCLVMQFCGCHFLVIRATLQCCRWGFGG